MSSDTGQDNSQEKLVSSITQCVMLEYGVIGFPHGMVNDIAKICSAEVTKGRLDGGIDELERLLSARQAEGRETDHHGIKLGSVKKRIQVLIEELQSLAGQDGDCKQISNTDLCPRCGRNHKLDAIVSEHIDELMTPASFQEQLDAYLATIITRETHKGSVNRVRQQARTAIQELVGAEVVKELVAAINAYNDYEEHRQEPSSDLKPGNLYLLDRIAALSSNQKEEK